MTEASEDLLEGLSVVSFCLTVAALVFGAATDDETEASFSFLGEAPIVDFTMSGFLFKLPLLPADAFFSANNLLKVPVLLRRGFVMPAASAESPVLFCDVSLGGSLEILLDRAR